MPKEKLAKIRESSVELSREVREKVVGYIVGALGLVAGLAWNDAVKAAIETIFPTQENSLWARFAYAIIISIIIVIISINLVRLTKQDNETM